MARQRGIEQIACTLNATDKFAFTDAGRVTSRGLLNRRWMAREHAFKGEEAIEQEFSVVTVITGGANGMRSL